MRETIRYWLLFLWQTAKIALWAVLFIGIIFLARVDFSRMSLSPYLLPTIITASAALPQLICGPGAYTLYMPLQLALGETRRNVFWGYLTSILVYALPPAGVCGALLALSPSVPNRLGLTLGLLLVQLLSGAFSSILGVLYAKFKIIACFIIGVVSACAGGGFVTINMLNIFSDKLSLSFLGQGDVLTVLAVTAAVLLLAGAVLTGLRLRRLEVKL